MLKGNTWFVWGKQTVCSGQIGHLLENNRWLVWLKDRFLLKTLLEYSPIACLCVGKMI